MAIAPTPTTNSGAIVESAPTDIWRLDPSAANKTFPAMNAKKPVIGGMPANRDVANCSGTAITNSVTAASRSTGSHGRRVAAHRGERNQSQPAAQPPPP